MHTGIQIIHQLISISGRYSLDTAGFQIIRRVSFGAAKSGNNTKQTNKKAVNQGKHLISRLFGRQTLVFWCERRDSNPYTFRRWNLNPNEATIQEIPKLLIYKDFYHLSRILFMGFPKRIPKLTVRM